VIHFAVPEAGSFSVRSYLEQEGSELAGRLHAIHYEELLHQRTLPAGCWVFAALDQLCPAEREILAIDCDALAALGGEASVLNDPRQVLLRPDLLRAAHAAGINTFRAFRPSELRSADSLPRFPVFVREANQHTGSLSPLLHDEHALNAELATLRLRGHRLDDLLVIEFCDTADEHGTYRKYSAFIVGERVLPRYLNFSGHWMVKQGTRLHDLANADEELAYLHENPHESWLHEVFALAGVQYGRIDYGVLDGRPQLWEINTNPTIGRVGPPRQRTPEAQAYRDRIAPGRALFYERFLEAWNAIDVSADTACCVAPEPPAALLERLRSQDRVRRRARTRRAMFERFAHLPGARALRRIVQPAVVRLAPRIAGPARRV
jgi:hypothetical protein